MRLEGGIFDIDGVLLDTPHEKAWRQALEELMIGPWKSLAPQTTYTPGAFTSAVYQTQVAGKPREAGAAAAPAYFPLPGPSGARAREYAQTTQGPPARAPTGCALRSSGPPRRCSTCSTRT